MATQRISTTQSSPDTEFRLFADATMDKPNRRWAVVCYIAAINRGTTVSYYGGSGNQKGYANGSNFRTHSGTPFLPSGVSGGGTRWNEGPYTVYVAAPENGQKTIPLRMTLSYGNVSYDKTVNLDLPDMGYEAPSTPGKPTVTSPSAGAFKATWAKPAGTVANYDLRYRVNNGAWVNVSLGNVLTYTKTGLTPGAKIDVEIQANNADASSGYSATGTTTMMAAAPGQVAKPTLSSPAAGQLTIDWDAPSSTGGKPITGYDIQYRIDGGNWLTTTDDVPPRGPLTGLKPGGVADVQVRAKNADATGAWSPTASLQLKATAPSAPAKPALKSVGVGLVDVTFTAPSDTGGKPITGYDIQYRVNGGGWTAKNNVTSPAHLTGIPSGTVEVQVRAKNADAVGAWSPSTPLAVVGGSVNVYVDGTFISRTLKARVGSNYKPVPIKQYHSGAWVIRN